MYNVNNRLLELYYLRWLHVLLKIADLHLLTCIAIVIKRKGRLQGAAPAPLRPE